MVYYNYAIQSKANDGSLASGNKSIYKKIYKADPKGKCCRTRPCSDHWHCPWCLRACLCDEQEGFQACGTRWKRNRWEVQLWGISALPCLRLLATSSCTVKRLGLKAASEVWSHLGAHRKKVPSLMCNSCTLTMPFQGCRYSWCMTGAIGFSKTLLTYKKPFQGSQCSHLAIQTPPFHLTSLCFTSKHHKKIQ